MNDFPSKYLKGKLLYPDDIVNQLAAPFKQAVIKRMIPHRAPFLLVDSVDRLNLTHRLIQTRREIAHDDPVFVGHFPDNPIYPGVLQQESLFQSALILLYFLINDTWVPPQDECITHAVGTRIYDVFHLTAVHPGDVLTIQCCITEYDALIASAAGQIIVNDQIVTCGKGEFYVC